MRRVLPVSFHPQMSVASILRVNLLTLSVDADPAIFEESYGVPILGICYGLQEIAWRLSPENVIAGTEREYGHADLTPDRHGGDVDRLFEGIEGSMQVVCLWP